MVVEKTFIYEPAEDTFLIVDFIEKNKEIFNNKRVLELGTGSALIAVKCSDFNAIVTASDINPYAIRCAKQKYGNKGIRFVVSDLFQNIKGKFDIIIFNPPYLPEMKGEDKEVALAVCGGKNGYEIISKFLSKLNNHLRDNGFCLLVFSSLTNKNIVEDLIIKNGFFYEQINSKKVLFETIYLYKIFKQEFLKNKKLEKISFLAKGKRSFVYKAKFKNKNVAVKVLSPKTSAKNVIDNEFKTLKLLNKFNIGPKVYFRGKNFVVMEFIKGDLILDFLSKNKKKNILIVLKELIRQCLIMDFLGINKEELCNPLKHIFIEKKTNNFDVKMIDFERAHNSKKPKNLTQIIQFFNSLKFKEIVKNEMNVNTEELIKISKEHKKYIVVKRDFDNFDSYYKKITDQILRCFS
ncbi:MAG: methyltransferase [Candidatus Woesearchaeota archaeon]